MSWLQKKGCQSFVSGEVVCQFLNALKKLSQFVEGGGD